MKKLILFGAACLFSFALVAPNAQAIAPFKKAFQEKYVDKSDNEQLEEKFKKAGCNTCHVKGEKKEVRNDYGKELSKLIEGDANARIKEAGEAGKDARTAETEKILKELDKAFDEVAKKENKSKVKYGELIKQGKLPVEEEEKVAPRPTNHRGRGTSGVGEEMGSGATRFGSSVAGWDKASQMALNVPIAGRLPAEPPAHQAPVSIAAEEQLTRFLGCERRPVDAACWWAGGSERFHVPQTLDAPYPTLRKPPCPTSIRMSVRNCSPGCNMRSPASNPCGCRRKQSGTQVYGSMQIA